VQPRATRAGRSLIALDIVSELSAVLGPRTFFLACLHDMQPLRELLWRLRRRGCSMKDDKT
jgi:hypothetical protein